MITNTTEAYKRLPKNLQEQLQKNFASFDVACEQGKVRSGRYCRCCERYDCREKDH